MRKWLREEEIRGKPIIKLEMGETCIASVWFIFFYKFNSIFV